MTYLKFDVTGGFGGRTTKFYAQPLGQTMDLVWAFVSLYNQIVYRHCVGSSDVEEPSVVGR